MAVSEKEYRKYRQPYIQNGDRVRLLWTASAMGTVTSPAKYHGQFYHYRVRGDDGQIYDPVVEFRLEKV